MILCFHRYVLIHSESTHYFKVDTKFSKNWHWYEYSIGKGKCYKCGKEKRRFKTTLKHLPYENDGSKEIILDI